MFQNLLAKFESCFFFFSSLGVLLYRFYADISIVHNYSGKGHTDTANKNALKITLDIYLGYIFALSLSIFPLFEITMKKRVFNGGVKPEDKYFVYLVIFHFDSEANMLH